MSSTVGIDELPAIDEDAAVETPDSTSSFGEPESAVTTRARHGRIDWRSVLVYGILPGLVLMSAIGCGYLKWRDVSARATTAAATHAVSAAVDSTVAILSYRPETADKDLSAASDRLTGTFRDSYTSLIHDVVIPGAKQNNITAVATVPAAASVSATRQHAVVLVFVNQTTTIGDAPPTGSASSVRVTLDKVADRWLISDFTPV